MEAERVLVTVNIELIWLLSSSFGTFIVNFSEPLDVKIKLQLISEEFTRMSPDTYSPAMKLLDSRIMFTE